MWTHFNIFAMRRVEFIIHQFFISVSLMANSVIKALIYASCFIYLYGVTYLYYKNIHIEIKNSTTFNMIDLNNIRNNTQIKFKLSYISNVITVYVDLLCAL
jgi:hypothetical protein